MTARSIWWHLAMEFHVGRSTVGHSPGPTRECGMCQEIAAVYESAVASGAVVAASKQASRLPAYEYIDRSKPFYEMTVEEQRDELLALTGLLVAHLSENLDQQRYPLMADLVLLVGGRMGPWAR